MDFEGQGFINDELELKFLLLYITARLIEPVTVDVILDIAMCDEGVNYFAFSECLNDLVQTGHLTLSEEGKYAITDKGVRNSQICESSLAYSVRLECDKGLAIYNRDLRRKSQVRAEIEKRPNGTYTVKMSLDDDMGSIMRLQLLAMREDMAKMLKNRFLSAPEQTYHAIMQVLMKENDK
ncbi:MAG: DUF4364 family protein [Oscillibacter sp.]|nr:DUF4364 family protein [Oscillibacter sp.]MBQ2996492.1 DUF4364 family protein [Oscillibacter sp.]